MYFMDTLETGEVPMELKYCERCGGLWLRPQGEDVVYCRGCLEHMAAWRAGERYAPRPRERQAGDLRSEGPIDVLAGAAAIEVRP